MCCSTSEHISGGLKKEKRKEKSLLLKNEMWFVLVVGGNSGAYARCRAHLTHLHSEYVHVYTRTVTEVCVCVLGGQLLNL